MRPRRDCLLALLLVTFAGLAQAQAVGPDPRGVREDAKILKRYDRDGDGVLNAAERSSALADFGFDLRRAQSVPPPAKRLTPAQVRQFTNESLFDPAVVRTVFLSFDTPTWEDELAAFKDSDVKIPATVVIDGKTLRNVGVSFHGQASYRMTGSGQKRSLSLDLGFQHREQSFLGVRRLSLLNAAGDPSFLHTVLYNQVARRYYPALGANFMRVVINGENWGIYVNQQVPDATFTSAVGGGSRGPVWQVPAAIGVRGGLEYLGEDPAPYQRVFELTQRGERSTAESWQALIRLCRVLNETPLERLPAALAPILDVDGVLRFLAVDNVLMNGDGYALRASGYALYTDAQGRFRIVIQDANSAMQPVDGGRRRRGAPRSPVPAGNEMSLSPLAGADQPGKALLHRLLAVPEYNRRYLAYIRDINDKWMSWDRLGVLAMRYQALIADDVRQDDRKLHSTEAFNASLANGLSGGDGPREYGGTSLKSFIEQRHAFLAGVLGER